jgi:hypothetical protein
MLFNFKCIPVSIPISISDALYPGVIKVLLTKPTRACHSRGAITKKPSYIDGLFINILYLVQQNHLSMSRINTAGTAFIVPAYILWRRLFVVTCCDNIVANLYKSNYIKVSTLWPRSILTQSLVLETPYSYSSPDFNVENAAIK